MNSRSITSATWERARKALVYYFSHRLPSVQAAEDLAQDTLLAVLRRDDYQFETEEDFLRVCYGFANRIVRRGGRRYAADAVSTSAALRTPTPESRRQGNRLRTPELAVLLQEVCRIGQTKLRDQDWKLIEAAMTADKVLAKYEDKNLERVNLHRARKKLATLTGWSK
jgi:DNA-directed RNA polymerase specialized sigma24 family protein